MSRTVPTAREHTPDKALLDPLMLDLLVCPRTHGALVFDETRQELVSQKAKLAYPVRDGVPILLAAEARALTDE
ncbi:MAG: Trm112 family protein [Pseudomonadota bacterium]